MVQGSDLEGLAAGLVVHGSKPISLKKEDGSDAAKTAPTLQSVAVHAAGANAAQSLQAGVAFAKATLLAKCVPCFLFIPQEPPTGGAMSCQLRGASPSHDDLAWT